MAERHTAGVLDTCTCIEIDRLDPATLPEFPEVTAVTMAELHQGVVMTTDPAKKAVRTEQLGAALVEYTPLPFDGEAAARYGTMVALTLAAGRTPRSRQLDLMIAAIASSRNLPLYTRNAKDFQGLESMLEVIEV
ncbi:MULTISPECIES: type II toxin-antitoxin system VapC family toxin [unclassified Amycolatopsis]|uniref:type II toxin-antitoxin system VapC family toxin n=1 Tax=unclassified Amycolatopsis TaxID=2618356 RepID=UPI002E0E59CF|nr:MULTISPECIES: type II toxin-antitoxin system VapC family toxin [unclassified Amycolatopsis]WSJ74991.1 type II toxin-antitoxin system VapC family toxin [Amycolatopsis sp. NBC_01307]WSK81336.1 type II toxin-antitoxin system VapC family toxin [Amycolatopsis sp. NBC_01286]